MTTPLTEADLAAIEARLFMDYPDHERWRDAFAQVKVDAEVRFVSFGELTERLCRLSPGELAVSPYQEAQP